MAYPKVYQWHVARKMNRTDLLPRNPYNGLKADFIGYDEACGQDYTAVWTASEHYTEQLINALPGNHAKGSTMAQERAAAISITQELNGFTVTTIDPCRGGTLRYVFEGFDTLNAWLVEHFSVEAAPPKKSK